MGREARAVEEGQFRKPKAVPNMPAKTTASVQYLALLVGSISKRKRPTLVLTNNHCPFAVSSALLLTQSLKSAQIHGTCPPSSPQVKHTAVPQAQVAVGGRVLLAWLAGGSEETERMRPHWGEGQ